MKYTVCALILGVSFLVTTPTLAQRGVGEDTGLSLQRATPDMVSISGTIAEVRIAPCEATTGRSILGAHVMLEEKDRGLLNIHLGPATDLAYLVEVLDEGDPFSAEVFRTDNLPADAFIARTVTVRDTTFTLRDETLRPVWAGSSNRKGRGTGVGTGRRGGGRGPRS